MLENQVLLFCALILIEKHILCCLTDLLVLKFYAKIVLYPFKFIFGWGRNDEGNSQFYAFIPFCRNDKGNSLNASYYHMVNPFTNTAVGAEVTHNLSTKENTLTLGTQHALDPLTSVKARVNNSGKASALIQHEWRPKSLFTISGEVDTKSIDKSAKVGVALALKPWRDECTIIDIVLWFQGFDISSEFYVVGFTLLSRMPDLSFSWVENKLMIWSLGIFNYLSIKKGNQPYQYFCIWYVGVSLNVLHLIVYGDRAELDHAFVNETSNFIYVHPFYGKN